MSKVITVAGLSQAARTYDPLLRVLPFTSLEGVASRLMLNIQRVENEDVIVNMRRKAGGTGAYKPGMTITYQEEIAKFFESALKPELVVYKIKDNINNYKDKEVLVMAGKPVDLKTKKHPLEQLICNSIVINHGEDMAYSIFHAERDEDAFSPMTSITGFFPALDMLTAAGYISAALKNVKATGEFKMPVDANDTEAYDKLVDFVASAHPALRSSVTGIPQLLITETVIKCARAAFRNKVKSHDYPTVAQMLESLREDAFCAGLIFSKDEALGQGGKLVLQKVGNMDIGYNTSKSEKFLQVRDIYEDPNDVQFWLEAAYGVRIRDIHSKIFLTNEQTNTRIDLSGDY